MYSGSLSDKECNKIYVCRIGNYMTKRNTLSDEYRMSHMNKNREYNMQWCKKTAYGSSENNVEIRKVL